MTQFTFARRRAALRRKQQLVQQHQQQLEHIMQSWKTTLVGALLAGFAFLSIYQANGGDLTQWQQWVIPFCIASLGWVAKDNNATGRLPLILCGGLCLLTIAACTNAERDAVLTEAKAAGGRVLKAGANAVEDAALSEVREFSKRHAGGKQPIPVTP